MRLFATLEQQIKMEAEFLDIRRERERDLLEADEVRREMEDRILEEIERSCEPDDSQDAKKTPTWPKRRCD